MEEKEKEIEEKPTKKRKKKGNVVLTTLLIIVLLVAFLGIGFAIGSTEVFKKIATTNDKGETVIKSTTESLSIYDEKVTEALKGFEQLGFNPEDSYTSKITDITKKDLVVTALKGLKNEQINYCKGTKDEATTGLTIDELNTSLKNAVADGKLSIEDIDNNADKESSYSAAEKAYKFKFKGGTQEEYGIITKDNKVYVIGPCGHEGPNATNIETQTEKAELDGDNLYIYQKVAFAKTEFSAESENFVEEYYTDKDYTNKVETISFTETPTWEKYNTYKLTFKKNGDKYYFESSEKE